MKDIIRTLDNDYIGQDGKLYSGAGDEVQSLKVWDGSAFGDDSKVSVVDNESKKTDLNGNVVKVVTHTHKHPVGIARRN